ncbi:hypothetical protein HYPSUDRAFT_197816 [Hypholoma sublateritium FD-334 SS-4]|uniref:Uncharacterized protein n=1 Tax=Hypholoma sublateritium (strain FD-334 SS-4) TaxID=945553 RepID=A0A0D2P9P6_HYPSF|nr:hypothetical protein HYPSUDRAFT_197816 [Hypholoma sublateritium FD-334 SS-4]
MPVRAPRARRPRYLSHAVPRAPSGETAPACAHARVPPPALALRPKPAPAWASESLDVPASALPQTYLSSMYSRPGPGCTPHAIGARSINTASFPAHATPAPSPLITTPEPARTPGRAHAASARRSTSTRAICVPTAGRSRAARRIL